MSFIFKDPDNKPVDPKIIRKRTILFSLPFALMGIIAIVSFLHDEIGSGFRMESKMARGSLFAAVVCGGLIALIFGISAKKHALKTGAAKSDDEKPWLERKDWADGRVASSSRKAALLLWIFVAFWCGISGVISLFIIPRGNHAAFIALTVIGLALIFFTLNTTLAWRKFNRSIFEMATVPAALGGTLQGEIRVKTKLQPQHGLHLCLSCVRRTTTGKSNNPQKTEKILWQDEKWLRADLPQTDLNVTGIPVYFKLPGDLPGSTASLGDGIHWKLEVSATLRGPNFAAAFEVPVFKLPEPLEISEDPTIQFQMSLDEMRKQIRSHIQVNDLPDGGKEFIFPTARNPGFASGATIICLIWTAIIALLVWNHAPLPFLFVFSAIDLLMAAFVFDLWLRRSRVAVNPEGLTVQRAWLAFQKNQRLQIGEIKGIASDVGATVGHAAYHDLKVHTRDEKEFVLAKNLSSKLEADWLVRQMIVALKRPS
ncbi:MAG TPA: hypothetical protein VGH42_02935 [Verrucomicrobiae bacterium]|jgi:hypothetical protein